MASKKQSAIGFPPPLLGDTPLRLPLLADADGWVAIDKPAGVGVRAYPWDDGVPHLDGALNLQLQAGKPELKALGAETFGSIYYLDPGVSGVSLFGKCRESIAELRNEYGSGSFEFRFLWVAPISGSGEPGATFEVDAPLLPHDWKLKMIPSTAKGKKAQTRFTCIDASPSGWALWEARTNYLRVHQVRAHAAVIGLPILGDALYGGPDSPLLRDVMPKKRGPGMQAPIFEGIALHLQQVAVPPGEEPALSTVLAELPNSFRVMLKRLGLNEVPK